MPKVESYGPRKVGTTPLPGVRRQRYDEPDYAGEAHTQFAGAVARLGTGLAGEIWQQERARVDTTRLIGAERELAEFELTRLRDPRTGVFTQVKGKDALGVAETVGREFDELAGTIQRGLPEHLQGSFERLRDRRREGLRQEVTTFEGKEMARYDLTETEAMVRVAQQGAIHKADTPALRDHELAGAAIAADRLAELQGLGGEARQAFVHEKVSQTHVAIIKRYLANEQDQTAATYFAQRKDEIVGDALAELEDALEEGSLRGGSQRAADAILAAGGTLAAQREQARAITDPQLRDAVMTRIEHETAFVDRQQREHYEAAHTQATNLLEQGGGDLRRIPPALWTSLSREDRAGLRSLAKDLLEGTPVKTDPNTYYFLSMLSTSSDPELRKQFLQTNILSFADRLSPEDRKHWIDVQSKTRQGDEAGAQKLLSNTAAQNAMVDEALVSMGLTRTDAELRKEDNRGLATRIGDFRRAVREAVARVEQRPDRQGKPATDEEVQSIVDRLRTPTGSRVTERGRFWNTTVPAYAFETAQAQAARVTDIPPGERRQIEAALRAAGHPLSDKAILELFNLQLSITRKDR